MTPTNTKLRAVMERLDKALDGVVPDDDPSFSLVASVFEHGEGGLVRPMTCTSRESLAETVQLLEAAALAIREGLGVGGGPKPAEALRCPFCGELARPTDDLVRGHRERLFAHRTCVARFIEASGVIATPASR